MHGIGKGAGAPGTGQVLLAWARDRTGAKVRAARLRPAERRARAPFTCLGCGEPVVPHLGPIRARHFAHLPGARCPLTAPETALHLDAKERLLALCAEAFAGAERVALVTRCPSCRRSHSLDLASFGESAEGEAAVGVLRADVLVRAGSRPSLAFEVRVTHEVDGKKQAALAAACLPFVEIDAREEWERAVSGTIEIIGVRSGGFSPCASCAALARADADRARGGEAAEIAELEAYRARGLFGAPRSGPPSRRAFEGGAESPPLSPRERRALTRRFHCPHCGASDLVFGERLVRHPCPATGMRPVAWRSYEGALVMLSWWRRPDQGNRACKD